MMTATATKKRFEINGNGRNGRHAPATAAPNLATRPGGKETVTWEFIDKAKADEYLANDGQNRDLMATLWAKYASDMNLDQWYVTHQGRAFDEAGNRVDGRHRLMAISETGKGQWMQVTRGLSKAAVEALDRGRNRSLAHALQIMGFDLANNRAVAMARAMHVGIGYPRGTTRPTEVTIRKFMEAHREALTFVQALPTYSHMRAGLTGLLARAYRHVAPADLTRFVRAMQDDVPVEETRPGDRSARALGLMMERTRQMGGTTSVIIYRKSQNALRQYLDSVDVKNLKEAYEDLFPLPEEIAVATV